MDQKTIFYSDAKLIWAKTFLLLFNTFKKLIRKQIAFGMNASSILQRHSSNVGNFKLPTKFSRSCIGTWKMKNLNLRVVIGVFFITKQYANCKWVSMKNAYGHAMHTSVQSKKTLKSKRLLNKLKSRWFKNKSSARGQKVILV